MQWVTVGLQSRSCLTAVTVQLNAVLSVWAVEHGQSVGRYSTVTVPWHNGFFTVKLLGSIGTVQLLQYSSHHCPEAIASWMRTADCRAVKKHREGRTGLHGN